MILRQDGADPTVGSGTDGGDGCHLPGGDASCMQIADAGLFFLFPQSAANQIQRISFSLLQIRTIFATWFRAQRALSFLQAGFV